MMGRDNAIILLCGPKSLAARLAKGRILEAKALEVLTDHFEQSNIMVIESCNMATEAMEDLAEVLQKEKERNRNAKQQSLSRPNRRERRIRDRKGGRGKRR